MTLPICTAGMSIALRNFHVDQSVDAHETLDHELFEISRPRHGDEKEEDGESEVPHPAGSAGQVESGGGNDPGG